MLYGDLERGELEIGQVCSMIKEIPTTFEMITKIKKEYKQALATLV